MKQLLDITQLNTFIHTRNTNKPEMNVEDLANHEEDLSDFRFPSTARP